MKAIFYDVERCKFNNATKNYNPIYCEVKITRKMKEQSRCKVRVPFMCSQLKVAGVDEYKTDIKKDMLWTCGQALCFEQLCETDLFK